MTGQGLLDRMELLNQELQLQSGEADVTRGLLALNVAQDHFESLLAQIPNVFGSAIGTVSTAASTESTAFPSGVLRVDRLQFIESSLPKYDLVKVNRVGGHRWSSRWPLFLFQTSSTGKPTHYWTNGSNIYWNPLPADIYTVRYYGFAAASDITAGGTFAYPDIAAFPLASFAAKVMKIGIDDDPAQLDAVGQAVFGPVISTLGNFNRDGAVGLEYTQVHTE